MDSIAILPKYRGHKLQYRLMQTAEGDLRAKGFKYLMCTVHPDNCYSRDNIVSQGYESVAVKEKYGGKCTWDELGLPVTATGLALPCGATGRWFSE